MLRNLFEQLVLDTAFCLHYFTTRGYTTAYRVVAAINTVFKDSAVACATVFLVALLLALFL